MRNRPPLIVSLAMLCCTCALLQCSSDNSSSSASNENVQIEKTAGSETGPKNGVYVKKHPDGSYSYKKTYRNDELEGTSLDYYPGKNSVRKEINYKRGKKNGKTLFFFESGQPFRITTYKDDIKQGIEEKFYDNGQMLSSQTYFQGFAGVDLKEWTEGGTPIESKSTIVAKRKGDKIEVELSTSCEACTFYYGPLKKDTFLHPNLYRLEKNQGVAFIPVSKVDRNSLLVFSSEKKTYLKNMQVKTASFEFSSL